MKDITLEMIDEFIHETGFDYDEARAYLLAAEGDVDLAVEAALAKDGMYGKSTIEGLLDHIKKLAKKGTLLRVTVRKDDDVVLNIPVGVGVVGIFFAKYLSAAGLAVALVTGHTVTLEEKNGNVINVQEYLDKAVAKAKEGSGEIGEFVKKGVNESKEIAKGLKDNIEGKIHAAKDTVEDEGEDFFEEAQELYEGVKIDFHEEVEDLKEEAEEIKEELEESLKKIKEELAVSEEEAKKEIKEEVEKKAKEKAEKEAKEKAEKEAKEKAEKEAKEKAEKEAKEKAEKEAKEKAEKEAKEKAEKEAKEKAEKDAKEKAEKKAKEKAEKKAKEKAEKKAKEKAEKEAKEKAEKKAKKEAEDKKTK
ncbi:MAG TPA: DUF4342 domain-containing protein [Clostridia bacterium]|nr:DUF4342 domain-containing protein [Clostridia bacterium]